MHNSITYDFWHERAVIHFDVCFHVRNGGSLRNVYQLNQFYMAGLMTAPWF